MKKRLVSILLAVAMCMGLTVPAFAADYEDLTLERAKNIIGKRVLLQGSLANLDFMYFRFYLMPILLTYMTGTLYE